MSARASPIAFAGNTSHGSPSSQANTEGEVAAWSAVQGFPVVELYCTVELVRRFLILQENLRTRRSTESLPRFSSARSLSIAVFIVRRPPVAIGDLVRSTYGFPPEVCLRTICRALAAVLPFADFSRAHLLRGGGHSPGRRREVCISFPDLEFGDVHFPAQRFPDDPRHTECDYSERFEYFHKDVEQCVQLMPLRAIGDCDVRQRN